MTLFECDALGAQTRSGLDVNGNGTLDLAGPDRVSESRAWYEKDSSNNWWQTSASILYPHDGFSAPVTNALQRTRLTGLGRPSDLGLLTSESLSQDLLGNQTLSRTFVDRDAKTVTQTTLYPDSTNAAIQVAINGLTQYSISKTGVRTDYAYDALGRQISARVDAASPPRSVGSYTHYNSLGQVDWVADALSNRTTFTYCPTTGRRISVTDALSNTTYTAYDPEGRVIATWGATYPVAYAYDAYGRMVVMATFRVEGDSGDQTQWLYDEATGLLTNKVYADGKSPSYAYTPQGQLVTRTWARGVVTTYAYATDGAMTNIAYSDGTPSVSFTYDRLGRQVAITDATGSRTFTYNAALQLAAETNAFGVLVRSYDALGRPAGFVLGSDYSVGYGFDEVGRFSSVTSFVAFVPFVVNYSYLTGTDLLSGWSSPTGHAVTRAFEPHRDLLTAVSNRYNGATVSAFDYLNDALARRTQRLDTGRAGPPDPPVTNRFAYNPRSELTSAAMGTNQYGYAYDPIGNRMSATNNAETLTYLSNALNQYTNITDGVTLTPTYDLDGNLTNYNGWTFAWSGENRLILASNTAHRVEYAYDYQGRMSQKVVDGQTNSLIWDGFNIIQVLTHTQTHTLTNAFIWGLDLSQSLQGAGGVGGLLAEVQDGAPHYAAFDANGNVTEYVSTNGTIVAHYEYSPFGEIVVQSGNLADSFTHRFSTKPWCAVTGTSEYELRMYSPELGRWISRDPIEEYGGWHLSAAMGNNMVCFWDLLGLANITADNGVPKNCTIVVIYDHGASRKKPKIIDDISPNSPMGEAAQKFTDEGYGGIGLIGCWSAQTIIQVDKLRKQQEQERTAKRAKRKVNIIPVPWINTLPGAEMSLVWRKLQPGLCQGEQINNIAGPGERPYLSGMNDMNSMDDFYYPPKRWSDINSGIDAGVKAKAKCLFNDGCRKVRVVYTDADGDVLVDADGAPLRDEIILPQ